MSSWFQDLAGKAENILNKIDQNAATVLQQQTDSIIHPTTSALTEVKCDPPPPSGIASATAIDKQRFPSSLLATPKMLSLKKPSSTTSIVSQQQESNHSAVELDFDLPDGRPPTSSSASTSRRSSVSSRADRSTVIEVVAATPSSTSNASNPEVAALKIVLGEIKAERDEARQECELLREQINSTHTRTVIKDLEQICVQLRKENEAISQRYYYFLFNLNSINASILHTERTRLKRPTTIM